MQRNTGYFPTESLEPSGNRLFSRSALNEGDLFRGSLEITPNYVLLPDAARVLEEPIGPLLKGMSQRQLQDVEEMVRIFVRNCRHEEKGRPRGGRRNMR